jgi:hypothetical protein
MHSYRKPIHDLRSGRYRFNSWQTFPHASLVSFFHAVYPVPPTFWSPLFCTMYLPAKYIVLPQNCLGAARICLFCSVYRMMDEESFVCSGAEESLLSVLFTRMREKANKFCWLVLGWRESRRSRGAGVLPVVRCPAHILPFVVR